MRIRDVRTHVLKAALSNHLPIRGSGTSGAGRVWSKKPWRGHQQRVVRSLRSARLVEEAREGMAQGFGAIKLEFGVDFAEDVRLCHELGAGRRRMAAE